MTAIGKTLRLRRVNNTVTGNCILFAASHGTSADHVFRELEDVPSQLDAAFRGGADSALMSVPLARTCAEVLERFPDKGFVAKLSATAYEDVPREVAIGKVEDALLAGADAAAVLMQLTPTTESAVIRLVADAGRACDRLGMPFIVEAELPGAYGDRSWHPDDVVRYLRRSCRLAEELGADIVKTNWPGNAEAFREVISATSAPTVVAGGTRMEPDELLTIVEASMAAGARGASVGRNIFQASSPQEMTERLARTVHAQALA